MANSPERLVAAVTCGAITSVSIASLSSAITCARAIPVDNLVASRARKA
jgi:hypothetical protein